MNISGAGAKVDGQYAPIPERLNDQDIFQKVDDETVKLFFSGGTEKRWIVGNPEAMNASDEQVWDGRLAARIEVILTRLHSRLVRSDWRPCVSAGN